MSEMMVDILNLNLPFFSSRANPSMVLIALNVLNSILVVLASLTVTSSVCSQTRSCRGQNVSVSDHIFVDSLLSREEM